MDWLTQLPIAHRGLHKGFTVPENSYKSFKRAIIKNYAIELDVRITKDKKIVVFHDKNLIRVCALKKKIANQDYINIRNACIYKTKQKIPLLSEILDLVKGQVPIVIEIKNYGAVGEFEELLAKELDLYNGKFAICSFNYHVVKWFKDNRPEYVRGFIFGDLKKFQIRFYKTVFLYRVFVSRPNFISLDYKLFNTLLPKICKLMNKYLICWTVDSKKKLLNVKNIADNIVFENIKP